MQLARYCKLCEYYIPSGKWENQGLCNRVDDPDFVYSVTADMERCLYEVSGQGISEQEHHRKLIDRQKKRKSFEETLERAARIVDSWPDWKKEGAGRLTVLRK